MNNNRNNRRGRGRNNRNQGNPNAQNRIDNRSRGNAPQLLDKYKKLAQDAYHNGDRVQQEYYLQFADHYFRVIADNKARQEEARAKRKEERDNSDDDDNDGNNRRQRGKKYDRDDNDGDRKPNGRGRKPRGDDAPPAEGRTGSEGEQGDNPFTRETKIPRKPRAKKPAADDGEIDASALPPAIGGADNEETKPKRTVRRRKPANDGGTAEAAE